MRKKLLVRRKLLIGRAPLAVGAVLALAAAPALAAPTPTVTKLEPSFGPGSGGTSVTITGTNFAGATAVDFGSRAAASFTVNSETSITAVSPAGSGEVRVTVTTPRGGTSNSVGFEYGRHKVFINGIQLTTARRPVLTVGEVALVNKKIGNITCDSFSTASAFNEATEGTEEKGFLNTVAYGTFECKSQNPCKVKNTRGAEVEGIYATAESPPEPAGTEAHPTGISSLPWTGEVIVRETETLHLLMKHVKLWIVLPPNTVGTGSGCLGTEVEVEDREGKTEKAEGDELAPIWLNGTKNGLKGSNEVFEGEEGLTEKGFPRTGRLSSPQVGPFYVKSNSFMRTGGLGGGWELVTVEF